MEFLISSKYSSRPEEYRGAYWKTYLKLTSLKYLKKPIEVTAFKKHDRKNVSKYGVERYARVVDPLNVDTTKTKHC